MHEGPGEPLMTGSPTDLVNPRTTSAVLSALDGTFASLAEGVAAGKYAFWLGSGISLAAVPGLAELLRKALVFLQERVVVGEPDCPYKRALREVLEAGDLSDADIAAIDLDQPVDGWPKLEDLLNRLISSYSKVLEVAVDGEDEEDFLLWEAIDVRDTYANSSLQPDAEHMCLAILILEGAIPVAASANWDGLIEESLCRLNGDTNHVLRVLVHEDEFRLPAARCDLIKFHGCAVKAKANPKRYRKLLVARKSQLARWVQNPDYAVAVDRLTDLVATRPTLMVGLSAQDANIQEIFSRAKEKLAWSWPSEATAIVFAEEKIGQDQQVILSLMYGTAYFPNRTDIASSARFGSYAKPLLLGLVLYTLAAKLSSLIASLQRSSLNEADLAELQAGIHSLRDALGNVATGDFAAFTVRLIESAALVLATFRRGEPPTAGSERYEPLSAQPIHLAEADPNVPVAALRNLAITASLLGKGAAEGSWKVHPGDPSSPSHGVCRITGDQIGQSKVFFVQDSAVLAKLETGGYVDFNDPDVLAIHASTIPAQQQRSPAARYGRSGTSTGREVAIGAVVEAATDAADLFERFRQEAAI
jgi:SIR2-like domain